MPFCVICEQKIAAWVPHPHRDYRGQFTRLIGCIGSNLDLYGCPSCGCNDRDRHLWLYMDALGLLTAMPNWRVLHVAPERVLGARIKALSPRHYVGGDIAPSAGDQERIDVENLRFEERSFDLIICNHVLEHVSDPDRALGELARCLSSEGHLIAQTPFSPHLKSTFEMSIPVSPQFARIFYGQEDHVRLFGADILSRFLNAGLRGELLSHERALSHVDPREYGCNEREPLFLFERT